jgi:hypothetical protein
MWGIKSEPPDRNVFVRLLRLVLRRAAGLDGSSARPFVAPAYMDAITLPRVLDGDRAQMNRHAGIEG